MTDFTVKVSLDVHPPLTFYAERERTVEIPPDYELPDRRRLYAVTLHALVNKALEELGWFDPLLHAVLANDARLSRIEELLNEQNGPLAEACREVINTGSQEAIDLWGAPPVEDLVLPDS